MESALWRSNSPDSPQATSDVPYRLVTGLGGAYQQSVMWGYSRASVDSALQCYLELHSGKL